MTTARSLPFLVAAFLSLAENGVSQSISLTPYRRSSEFHVLTQSGTLENRTAELPADSGNLLVAENRSNPGSRMIRLPVVRIRSLDSTSSQPVFWLSGGPGQSNLHSFQYDYFLPRHDHVMVGYRGVDGEVSLECPEVIKVLQEGGDILSDEVLARVREAFSGCAERLSAGNIDLDGYTPVEVAKDLEDARKALGYESIDIVAESFGTRIAYYYALLYPERVHRLIMIGANPPGGMVWNAQQYDTLLLRYGELWKASPARPEETPDLIAAIQKVNGDFPRRWLIFPIHEGTVKASVNAFLFHTGTAAQAFDAYRAAADGDASGLWLISFVGSRIFPDVVNWGDNASKAVSADFDSTRDYVHELNPPNSLMSPALGAFLWAPSQGNGWPIHPVDPWFRQPHTSSVSTLFLSGSLDFSTPAQNVETSLVPFFPRGHHVILAEAGHILDLWQSQPSATHRLLTIFLDTGNIDTSLVRYTPVSFEVEWGFPLLAKLFVGISLAALVAVAWGVWFVVRKLRKKLSLSR